MLPAYLTCVITKFALAMGLVVAMVHEPIGGYKEQLEWLWAWWCAHNTYAWVRMWMAFFTAVKAMRQDQYSVAVMLAGAVCCGQAVGFLFLILFFAIVALHQLYLGYIASRLQHEIDGCTSEIDASLVKMTAKRHTLYVRVRARVCVCLSLFQPVCLPLAHPPFRQSVCPSVLLPLFLSFRSSAVCMLG